MDRDIVMNKNEVYFYSVRISLPPLMNEENFSMVDIFWRIYWREVWGNVFSGQVFLLTLNYKFWAVIWVKI